MRLKTLARSYSCFQAVGGLSVMVPALRHFERLRFPLAGDAINQSMFAVDAAGPPAAKVAPERLGFAGTAKGIAGTLLEQFV